MRLLNLKNYFKLQSKHEQQRIIYMNNNKQLKLNIMNTQLQNYLDLQNKIDRIEQLTNADWDTRYMLEKFVPTVWNDSFDVQDIIDYITVKLHEVITKLENEKEIITTQTK